MLMVRPKSLHASENLSTLHCMSAYNPAFGAQSSAKRKSLTLMMSVMTVGFARSLLSVVVSMVV